jgi:hypothetical protein
MPGKYERSSDLESVLRAGAVRGLATCMLALAGCSPVQAEVGSGLPPSADAHVSDTGAPIPCNGQVPMRLYYRNAHVEDSSSIIDYLLKLENLTAAPVPLASFAIRYYFTNELPAPSSIDIFYADTCCSNKVTNFNADVVASMQPIPARPGADAYLEVGFAPALGSLASGDAVQVELGFHDPAYARNVTQENDYSYAPTAVGTQAEWDSCPGPQCNATFTSCAMTVYQDGALVWGTPP